MRGLVILVAVVGISAAQTSSVQANGSATISVQPDQVQLSVGVVTQAATAADAAAQNATVATAMINAIKTVLGSNGDVTTIYYSISPRYSNQANQTPTIVGYTVSNTVQVTSNDINLAGRLIDAANAAGANSVNGPSYGLRDPEPYVQKALSQAAKQATAHAAAIAAGLGAKTGAVLSATEGSQVYPVLGASAAGAASTPIQSGTVSVSATVTVTVALLQ